MDFGWCFYSLVLLFMIYGVTFFMAKDTLLLNK